MNALTLKNLLREIKRTFTKFLSIFAICALGVLCGNKGHQSGHEGSRGQAV